MAGKSLVLIDAIRTLAFGGIGPVYASVGTAFTHNARLITITNNTQGDLYFTNDITQDKIFVPALGFRVLDLQANMNAQFDDQYVLPIGTQISVKQITAPVSGAVYVEVIY